MKNILLAAAAVISLGLAGTASAAPPEAEIGFKNDGQSLITQAGCYYRYFYVTNGYQYRYFYSYYCY